VLTKAALWRQISRQPINARQRMVISGVLEGFEGALTTSKYAKLATCSSDTALRDIQELIGLGVLVQNESGGRNTSYRIVVPTSGEA
jgi:Fic family protein